jgi:hypothetical protein
MIAISNETTHGGFQWRVSRLGLAMPLQRRRGSGPAVACRTFGAGKSYADDQADDMIKETKSLKLFDTWVSDFVEHVRMNGIIPNIKEAERSARSTTNQDKI